MALDKWTHADQDEACREGWLVAENSDHGMRIEKADGNPRFDCDAAAQAFVAVRAMEGDTLARSAWRELAWHHAVMDAARGDVN